MLSQASDLAPFLVFNMTSTLNVESPKPVPHIFNTLKLTTKKEKYSNTPKIRQIPPRPPCKSISKITRLSFSLNNTQNELKPHIISFKNDSQHDLSKFYDESLSESYFKQCFFIEEKIGSGSFGDVYKVKSREDNKYYAVKVSRERFKGKLDREEKLNEVCKHEQLPRHDHLVKFHKAWEEKQRLYIQTELCSRSLSSYAETNHDISEDIIWRYLIDLLKAVEHIHSNNLIHLDIKPENIFISRNDICKLGDFGLVVDANDNGGHISEATDGDPKYLASEIMQGIYTKAADIFSLGMTVLELALDLDLPSRDQGWHMLRQGNIPDYFFSKLSSELRCIITLMINPDFQLRPSASELLNHPIVIKYEQKRRRELLLKSYLEVFSQLKSLVSNFWEKFLDVCSVITIPFLNWLSKLIPSIKKKDDSQSNLNSSPINYNKAYVSNFLDQYSDDDSNDVKLISESSLNSPTTIGETSFKDDNLKNLCSTVYRNSNNPNKVVSSLSPFFPVNNGIDDDPIKSVAQRLTFDDFSSDEMEMTENDEDEKLTSPTSTSLSSGSNESRLKFRQNVTRKNLAKTFDELENDLSFET